jgi:predicted protein tyrosine phosphatase
VINGVKGMRKGKLLFICSANSQRSPTAEHLFQNWNGDWKTKSAGTMPEVGCNPLTQELVDWADLILVMESHHCEIVQSIFRTNHEKIKVLHIPDIYVRNDPELIRELKRKVIPILDTWASNH